MSETPQASMASPDLPARSEAGLPLHELIAALRRRQRVIVWVVVLITGIATLIGLQADKTYTATSLVMIQPQENRVVDFEQVARGLSADTAAIQTQIKFIQSYENLAHTVQLLNLDRDPAFARTVAPAGALSAASAVLPDKWLIAAGLADAPGVEPDREEVAARAIGALRGGLKVSQSGTSYVLELSYTAPSANEAAQLANGIAKAYVQGQLDDKLAVTRGANDWLTRRVDELRLGLLASERSVEEYRTAHGLGSSDMDAQQIAALTAELIDARAEQTAQEAKLRKVHELRASGDSDAVLADLLSSPLIITLRGQELDLQREEALLSREYGERHPRIVQLQAEKERLTKRIDLEIGAAIQNLQNQIAVAQNRAEGIQKRLADARGELALSGQAALQLRELEREASANRSLYQTFLVRLKETEEQQQLVQPDVRIISPAEIPGAPSSASPISFAFVGFTASTVIGALLALLMEQLDTRLRSTRQVEELLEVPSLGLVPDVAGLEVPLHKYLTDRPESAYAQAVRALYAQLRLREVEGTSRVLLVTSALPGEGKTSLAASLATCAAELQQRTVLIDLDLRRPKVAREFRLEPRVGVVELLEGEIGLEDALWRDQESGVDVLPVAGNHANPFSLLTSPRLTELMKHLDAHYDCVVIDSPPVLGVPDAKTLAGAADTIVFVLRWDRTTRAAAQAALKELRPFSAPIAGAVLSRVDLKRHAQYSYGDAGQYYMQYSTYYRD